MRLNVVSLEDRIDRVRDKLGDKIEVEKLSSVVGEIMGSFDGNSISMKCIFRTNWPNC